MLDQQSVIALARQGDVKAIADMMNYHFNPKRIQVKVVRQNSELLILLEAPTLPQKNEAVPPIRCAIRKLGLTDFSVVRIAARQPGESKPQWKSEFELAQPSPAPPTSLADWLGQGGVSATQPAIVPDSSVGGDQGRFLRFQVNSNTIALFHLEQIRKILQIPVQDLLPVPHMPEFVVGVYNYRGEIIWLIDLSQQLGIDSPYASNPALEKTLTAIVIQHQTQLLGLLIPQILGIESHEQHQILPPTHELLSTNLMPFVQGYFAQPMSFVLNANALLNDARLQVR